MNEGISIVATTYCPPGESGELRATAAIQAMDSWDRCCVSAGPVDLILADDGSDPKHWDRLCEWTKLWTRGAVHHTQGRGGVGASLNRGFGMAFEHGSDIALYAVDDWALTQPFDLDPWIRLLRERSDVGVCRLGPPHPGNVLTAEPFTGDWQGWAARLAIRGIVASHRPALWHRRMIEHYGWFDAWVNALECEAAFDARLTSAGPAVVLALPHPWRHIDSIELADADPVRGELVAGTS